MGKGERERVMRLPEKGKGREGKGREGVEVSAGRKEGRKRDEEPKGVKGWGDGGMMGCPCSPSLNYMVFTCSCCHRHTS